VDQVLGVMTKEIQENLESACKSVEDRLLMEVTALEQKMARVEDAYEHIQVDARLCTIEQSINQLQVLRAGVGAGAGAGAGGGVEMDRMTYEGMQPKLCGLPHMNPHMFAHQPAQVGV
jgi:hypothetical protein